MTTRITIESLKAADLFAPSGIHADYEVFDLGSFALESGAILPNAKLAYATQGALNVAKTNAILLPSHYGADHHGYDYLIGPGKTLDPANYFLVLTNMFANGLSSSPSNTLGPFQGPDFPAISIRDNVAATHALVTRKFGITSLKAVVGFSMGAQQAFQWAVSHPDMMQAVVVLCGNAKQYPFGIIRIQGSISALKADGDWNGGHYTRPPERGLRAMGMHYRAWTRSAAAWPRDLFDGLSEQELADLLRQFEEGLLDTDANNLISQAETWKRHNVGDTSTFGGRLDRALGSIRAKVLLMPSTTDQYFLLADADFERQFIQSVTFKPINTVFGHTGGGGTDPAATAFIDQAIQEHLQ
jgi:homoserine O-acetyltransferase